MTAPTNMPFYVTGGTLPPDATSYVERAADKDLLAALLSGEYCYVLNSRQMGKSSLSVRTIGKLKDAGVQTVFLDLTRFGGGTVTPEQWYVGMLAEIGRVLNLRREMLAYWKEHQEIALVPRFFGAIVDVALHPTPDTLHPVTLFIDEIDAVKSLSFSTDEFFAALRELYNRRVQDSNLKRLTICLVGSATPSDLIADTRTSPFNIGKRIELRDFTRAECGPLGAGFGVSGVESAASIIDRIFHWTNGHPYLTQALCAAAVESVMANVGANIYSPLQPADVDRLVENLFLEVKARERNPNLSDVSNRILSSYLDPDQRAEHRSSILDLYGKILNGRERVADDETNRLVALLKLAGVVRSEGGRLVVRNRIYERVFDKAWIEQSMPDAELRRVKAAYRRGVIRTAGVSAALVIMFAGLAAYGFRQARAARAAQKQATELTAAVKLQKRETDRQAYFSSVELLQREWEAGNTVRAAQLLEATRNSSFLGMEWDYWFRIMNRQTMTLSGHTGAVNFARFSKDGSKIVTTSLDGTARIWDAATGRLIATLAANTNVGSTAEFSMAGDAITTYTLPDVVGPTVLTCRVWDALTGAERSRHDLDIGPGGWNWSGDGRRVLVYGDKEAAKVCDTLTGKVVTVVKGEGGDISDDGRRVVTTSQDGKTRLWDAETGRVVAIINVANKPGRFLATFSKVGRHLMIWAGDSHGEVWDAEAGRKRATVELPTGTVTSLGTLSTRDVSPDGRWFAVPIDPGQRILVRDLHKGVQRVLNPGLTTLSGIDFCRDGSRLMVTGDGSALLYDTATGRQLAVFRGHAGNVGLSSISPDGSRVVTAGVDGSARVWQVSPVKDVAELATSPGSAPAYPSPDGSRILHVSAGDLTLLDAGTGRALAVVGRATQFTGAFTPDSRMLFVSGPNGEAAIWDAVSGRLRTKWKGTWGVYYTANMSSDGRRVVTVSFDNSPRVWDTARGVCVTVLKGHSKRVTSASFFPDGTRIVTSSENGSVRVWGSVTGHQLVAIEGVTGYVPPLISPDGRWLYLCGKDGKTRVYDSATGRQKEGIGDTNEVFCSFSPDGTRIAAYSSSDTTARSYDVRTGRALAVLRGHADTVNSVIFSRDGTRVLTASKDHTARLWDAESGLEVAILRGHTTGVSSAFFSTDAKRIITVGENGTARIWFFGPDHFDWEAYAKNKAEREMRKGP